MIDRTVMLAKQQDLTSALVTFEPHPRAYFSPQTAPGKIQGLRAKASVLARLGIDELWILRFGRSLATMSAEDFMQKFLFESLQAKDIVIGDDFRFGARRQGNLELLQQASGQYGWHVHCINAVHAGGERASSSRLRSLLARGEIREAEALMGHPVFLSGHVIHGKKLGRNLGYPTLNIPVPGTLLLSGVFVVSVSGLAGAPIAGVASLGHRPTIEQSGRLLLEVHLFDWSGDAYGNIVEVTFHEKLRDEARFESLQAMTEQMHLDAQQARQYFSQHVH